MRWLWRSHEMGVAIQACNMTLKKSQLSIKFTGPARPVAEKHSSKADFILMFSTTLEKIRLCPISKATIYSAVILYPEQLNFGVKTVSNFNSPDYHFLALDKLLIDMWIWKKNIFGDGKL